MKIAILLLVLIGSLSPLLTFCYLWQVKEWRIDRLREHIREEGVLSITGKLRPLLLVLCLAIAAIELQTWPLLPLGLFAALSIAQWGLRRQPRPVWTQKARAMALGSTALTAMIVSAESLSTFNVQLSTSPLLVVIQPFIVLLVWLGLFPLDTHLKNKVMNRARDVRNAHPDLTVIGITGSAGKTTTKELLAHVLADLDPLVTPAHVNTEMGVSSWFTSQLGRGVSGVGHGNAQRPTPNAQILVIEMGAYRQGEIANLCSIVQPTMGVITMIGSQHIALFGSADKLRQAKGELVDALPADGHAFLNADNKPSMTVAAAAPCPVTTVGTGGEADLEAFDIEETAKGIRFRCENTVFSVPLHGTHNVTNLLLTIAVARSLGLQDSDIQEKLKTFKPPSQTFAVEKQESITLLNDTHNSSPASVKAGIAWAANQPYDQKTLLMTGMIELGSQHDTLHTEMGTRAATVFDRVIFINPKSATAFEKGYNKPVELLEKETAPVSHDSLLVCAGRMSPATIKRLLP